MSETCPICEQFVHDPAAHRSVSLVLRRILEGLELRRAATADATKVVDAITGLPTPFAEGRVEAFDEAIRLVRRAGGLDG